MSDHLVFSADHLITSESLPPMEGHQMPGSSGECSSSRTVDKPDCVIDVEGRADADVNEEEEPLIQRVECRICQEEDGIKNMEVPCVCSGSLKYAHRKCVQRWCNEKGDTTCEICHQPYQPGYTAPPPPPQPEDSIININGLTISGSALDARDPRVLALAAAERRFLEADYDDYADTGASGASFCRSVALILMALLLLRHAMTLTDDDGDDDASKIFSIFLLRAAGFLLPCYIMAWAVSILQRRRQRQEAAAIAASEVAFMLEAGQRRGIHFMIAPGSAVIPNQAATPTPHQEQTQ